MSIRVSPAKYDLVKMGLRNLGSNTGHQVQDPGMQPKPLDVTTRGHMTSKGCLCSTQERSYFEASGFKALAVPEEGPNSLNQPLGIQVLGES